MQYIKNQVFLYLTPRQKSMLFSYFASFVKKNKNLSKGDIIDKFIENENYYFELNNPHFEFVIELLSDDDFLKDLGLVVDYVFFEIEQKEKLKPIIEKQKQYQKEQRKRAQDFKMSKLKPTKKQLFYYEKVAKAHNVEMKNTENATRLDLRNWIMDIIDKSEENDENQE